MQLNITTDYAIRTVLALEKKDKLVTVSKISEQMHIPEKYLSKILKKLKDAQIVGSISGVKGGYYLLRELSEIKLKDILEVMETTTRINRCLEEDNLCSRNATETCPIRKYYTHLQKLIDETVMSITIQGIIDLDYKQNGI